MILANKNILLISPEPWDHIFVSKHHYAIELGKKGNKVFFLNPPSGSDVCSETVYQNVYTIDYKPFFRGLNRIPQPISRTACMLDVRRIFNLCQTEFDVVWSFDPYRFQAIDLFRAGLSMYYAADSHANRKAERLLADRVSLVLSPSQLILDCIDTKTRKVFLNHAVAEHFFEETCITKLPGENAIKVGYVGNLRSRFLHFPLLKKVIEMNPQCDFVFVGDDQGDGMMDIGTLANVFFQGLCPNHKVPSFLKSCDILLLCYDTEKYWIEASNSHKIMEYLASGRPIVSTPVSEYIKSSGLIVMANPLSDLPLLVKRMSKNMAEHNDMMLQAKRIEFAKANTYQKQLGKIEEALDMEEIHRP